MGFFNNPLKAIKKGISHAAEQVYKEQKKILKKPVESIDQGLSHLETQIRKEVEKELKEKYNHAIHHTYDLISAKFKGEKDVVLQIVGVIMEKKRSEILTLLEK